MNIDFKVEKLRRDHVLEGFDCGKDPLNRFLVRNALQSQQANGSQTYVALAADRVVGYHTLVVGEVAPILTPERIKKGLGAHSVPIMLLARLAVSQDWKGRGIGSALLKDALLRTLQAADIAGIRAFAVHAKDDEARRFYRRFDFEPSPSDPFHLFLILKDVRALLR
jgi:GNAT superfamily N-acetyltransferase